MPGVKPMFSLKEKKKLTGRKRDVKAEDKGQTKLNFVKEESLHSSERGGYHSVESFNESDLNN